ncbi:MAG: poly(R)-hydroxyalkanoic acid synthase subunit PhaE [Rubrivivax sp.]
MAEATQAPPGAPDWFAQQQAIFEAMTQSFKQAASAWPAPPGAFDPTAQATLKNNLARFGLNVPDAEAALPSLADALIGPMMSRLTQAPTFAHLWDMDQKLAGLSAAWAALHGANAAYHALIARGWATAQKNLLAKAPPADAKPADLRAGTDAWLAELNAALLDLMRSDEYLALQKRLLDAGLQVREQLRKLGEDMAEWFQLPSRNEVDDLARAVTELRRELRRERRRAAAPTA